MMRQMTWWIPLQMDQFTWCITSQNSTSVMMHHIKWFITLHEASLPMIYHSTSFTMLHDSTYHMVYLMMRQFTWCTTSHDASHCNMHHFRGRFTSHHVWHHLMDPISYANMNLNAKLKFSLKEKIACILNNWPIYNCLAQVNICTRHYHRNGGTTFIHEFILSCILLYEVLCYTMGLYAMSSPAICKSTELPKIVVMRIDMSDRSEYIQYFNW